MIIYRKKYEGINYIYNRDCTNFQNIQTKNESCAQFNINQKLFEDLSNADISDFSPDENDSAFFLSNANFSTKPNFNHSKRVQEFMLVLALCNTVVISTHSHKNEVCNFKVFNFAF